MFCHIMDFTELSFTYQPIFHVGLTMLELLRFVHTRCSALHTVYLATQLHHIWCEETLEIETKHF